MHGTKVEIRHCTVHVSGGGTPEVVKVLLDAGADLDARDRNGWTPLYTAVSSWMVLRDGPAVVKMLLDGGADPNEIGSTLRRAVAPAPLVFSGPRWENAPVVVQALLDAGADPNAQRDEDWWTPLHWAVRRVDARHSSAGIAVVQALLDAGADPNARTASGKTAFDLIPDDSPLRDTDVYWQLNDARF